MKGLLTKDFLTIKKKYGLPRVIMDIAIIIALMFILEKSGTIYISFLLIPIEIMSMIISHFLYLKNRLYAADMLVRVFCP